jgi:mRNA interferase MazF
MRGVNPSEVWAVDFGMAAKVRPALILTSEPALDELDIVTVLLHTTALRGNRWELSIPKPFLKAGAFHLQQIQMISTARLERRPRAPKCRRNGSRAQCDQGSAWNLRISCFVGEIGAAI